MGDVNCRDAAFGWQLLDASAPQRGIVGEKFENHAAAVDDCLPAP